MPPKSRRLIRSNRRVNGGPEEDFLEATYHGAKLSNPTSNTSSSSSSSSSSTNNGTISGLILYDDIVPVETSSSPPAPIGGIPVGGKNESQSERPSNGTPMQLESDKDVIVVGALIGLIVILCSIVAFLTIPAVIRFLRRRIPVSQKRIDRRYETIDKWLVTKTVQPHDQNCDSIKETYATTKDEVLTVEVGTIITNRKEKAIDENEEFFVEKVSLDESHQRRDGEETFSQSRSCHTCDATTGGLGKTVDNILVCQQDLIQTDSTRIPIDALLVKLGIPEKGNKRSRNRLIGRNKQSTEKTEGSASGIPDPKLLSPNEHNKKECMNTMKLSDASDDHDNTDGQIEECHSHASVKSDTISKDSLSKQSCSICLDNFKVGDTISWSTSEKCQHTYHHTCIREWLLRKVGCPYCREVVLPVDRPTPLDVQHNHTSRRGPLTDDQLCKLANERGYRATSTYFCVDCGLVSLGGYGNDHWKKIHEQYRKREKARTRSFQTSGGSACVWKLRHHAWGLRWKRESDEVEGRDNTQDGIDRVNVGIGNNTFQSYSGSPTTTGIRTTMSGDLSYQQTIIVTSDTMDEDDDSDENDRNSSREGGHHDDGHFEDVEG